LVVEATAKISKAGEVVVPWTTRVALGVELFMPKLPAGVTVKIAAPVEVLIWKGFKAPVPWTSRETVAEEALTPKTLPLSIKVEVAVVVAPMNLTA
jgi:hypothetical protein